MVVRSPFTNKDRADGLTCHPFLCRCDSAFLSGVTLMLFSCVVWLKLVSYAHTNYDMRQLTKSIEKVNIYPLFEWRERILKICFLKSTFLSFVFCHHFVFSFWFFFHLIFSLPNMVLCSIVKLKSLCKLDLQTRKNLLCIKNIYVPINDIIKQNSKPQ